MDADRLARWFTAFAEIECPDLPLYRTLSLGMAADAALIGLLLDAAPGQWRPNLLLAALHDLVLRHPDAALSQLYPTVGGAFDGSVDPMPLVRTFVDEHAEDVQHLITTRSTQTNEVNRSSLWYAAVRSAAADLPGRPVALVEVGASAGLNLAFDRYAYSFGDGRIRGETSSPVGLSCHVKGPTALLDAPLEVAYRVGIDRAPVDLDDAGQRRWLKACIWPEQPIRHARFDAAAELCIASPPTIVADDAVDGISDVVDGCPDDAHVVIVNSWVMTYLPRERRVAFDAAVDLLGQSRDITRISAEGEGVVDWVPLERHRTEQQTVVGMRRHRAGRATDRRAGTCHPHLQWLDWLG